MDFETVVLPGVDSASPFVIAGPCSAETEEQVLSTAQAVAAQCVKVFRCGIWKPRTKPGGFEGVGAAGLDWLKRVQRETGMLVTTEVANKKHVSEALAAGIDILWLGARTTVNPFAIQEIADALRGVSIPVLVKNPINPDLELWIGAIERLHRAGLRKIIAVHRGFSSYGIKKYRNSPMWQIPIELRRRFPSLPILCDPSHIAGSRNYIAPLCQQAMDLQFNGLMIETHFNPDAAWSDAAQQISPETLGKLLSSLVIRNADHHSQYLSAMRFRIDQIDEGFLELLARRMQLSIELGEYKKANNMPVLQTMRYSEIIDHCEEFGKTLNLEPEFVRYIIKAIHEESIRRQMAVMDAEESIGDSNQEKEVEK